jgi:hypothetical protein
LTEPHIHVIQGFMQRLQVLFPDPTMARLRAIAAQEDRPLSELIRSAVDRFLERKPPKQTEGTDLPTFSGGKILVGAGDLTSEIYRDDAV